MNNKNRTQVTWYLFIAMILVLAIACKKKSGMLTEKEKQPPNVLFIAVDDLNTMLGSYGGPAKTPNINKLAAMGVQFNDAHCQAPLCGPSRASVMTGLRPSTTGIYGMIPDNKIISDNPVTKNTTLLPEYFKKHGYYTMGIGKLFHMHAPDSLFDESGSRVKGFGPYPKERFVWDGYGTSNRKKYGRTSTDWGAFPENDSLMPDHESVNWVIDRLHKNYDTPFFMGLGFLRVHVPLYVPQKWFNLYPLDSIKTLPYKPNDLNDIPQIGHKINDLPMMPTTDWAIKSGEWPKIIQAYLACISFVDYEIGRVLNALENSEHANNTIIVLWSDHGYRLGEKGTFNQEMNNPTELLSIYPTLLELCGLPRNTQNEGKSLVPNMLANKSLDTTVAITTFGMNNHAIKSKQYRYIRYEDGGEEFYNHQTDAHEFTNLIGQAKYTKEIEKLKALLPKQNAVWDLNSSYNFQPYFVEQKKRVNGLN